MAPFTSTDQAAAWLQATAFANAAPTTPPKACALYARISPKPKENREVAAIETQLHEMRLLAERLGWPVCEEFVDKHISAYSKKPRPEYERMKQWALDGRIDAVIAWRPDRLHRRPVELGEFLDLAQQCHLRLASSHGQYDISTPAGRSSLWMQAVFAMNEMEVKRERMLDAYRAKARKGEPWGTTRPFGYVWARDDKGDITYDAHRDEAPVVRELYRMLLGGSSVATLLRYLEAGGWTTTKGAPWVSGTLRAFLLHPRNAGLRTFRSSPEQYAVALHHSPTGKGNWEGLVSETTWRAAKNRLLTNSRSAAPQPKGSTLLSGIAVCGYCHQPVTSAVRAKKCKACPPVPREVWLADTRAHQECPHTKPQRTYRCSNPACLKVGRPADYIDRAATEALLAWLERPDISVLLAAPEDRDEQAGLHEEAQAIKGAIKEWAARGARLGPDAVEAATAALREDLARVEERLGAAHRSTELADIAGPHARAFWEALPDGPLGMARKRAIAKAANLNVVLAAVSTRGRLPADPDLAADRRAQALQISLGGTR